MGPRSSGRRGSAIAVAALVAAFCTACTSVPAPGASTPATSASAFDPAPLNAALDAVWSKGEVDGTAMGLWIPGQPEWVAVRGIADRSTQRAMSRDDQQPIGSVTKTFTSLMALQLVGEGALSLDATIDRWYPDYPMAGKITIRQLMDHSSGIADISTLQLGIRCADTKVQPTPDSLIEGSAAQPRESYAPGQGFTYSSANTIILGRILEKVTGSSYADLLDQRLFTPVKMKDTRLDSDGVLREPYAHGYTDLCAPGLPKGTDASSWPQMSFAAGALASTIDDLHRYGVALGEGLGLTPEVKKERFVTAPGSDGLSGLGILLKHASDGQVISLGHTGGEAGYSSDLLYYPCSGAVFTILINGDFQPAMTDLLGALLPVVEQLATQGCPLPSSSPSPSS